MSKHQQIRNQCFDKIKQIIDNCYESKEQVFKFSLKKSQDNRINRNKIKACGLSLDYSSHLLRNNSVKTLIELANHLEISETIRNLEAAQPQQDYFIKLYNSHMGLRDQTRREYLLPIHQINDLVHYSKKHNLNQWICLGIGGSHIGPKLLVEALYAYTINNMQIHFISNCDGYELDRKLKLLNNRNTGVIINSRSFTTDETLLNATSIKSWLGEKNWQSKIFAVTAAPSKAIEFGINKDHIFTLPTWIVGRYSVWSVVSLAAILTIGLKNFQKFLQGACDLDSHFKKSPLENNMPVILALLTIWYVNGYYTNLHAIIPYSYLLRSLPYYVRQLEMESNGKLLDRNGKQCSYPIGTIILPDIGCHNQHSTFQYWYQGSNIIPTDYILPLIGHKNYTRQQQLMITSCLSQRKALARRNSNFNINNRFCNQPSSLITMKSVNPYTLGVILALYEHKTLVESILWNINPYDQPGIEIGKATIKKFLSKKHANIKILHNATSA